jgi:hypothetical protein
VPGYHRPYNNKRYYSEFQNHIYPIKSYLATGKTIVFSGLSDAFVMPD